MKLKNKLIIETLKKQVEVLEHKLAECQEPTETYDVSVCDAMMKGAMMKDTTIEEVEYEYPLYFESTYDGTIVKFTDINTGVTVKLGTHSLVDIGISTDSWTPHTDAVWKPVAYNEERDLFDKQLVWCWDNETNCRIARFFDAKNDEAFYADGSRHGVEFNNYEAYRGEYPEWAKEAYKTLED